MTHLRIELNGITEEVSSSVISKLYEIVHAGVDASSNLLGRLHTTVSYRTLVEYLTTLYPDLYISSDNYAILFEDPTMITHLNSVGIGSNGVVTEADARNATTISYVDNDVVTKFNELRYFTNINKTAAPRWGEDETGSASFRGWSALEEIDISNYVSVGRYEGYSSEWSLLDMAALITVTASDKLKNIGYSAFSGDSNLTTISGLSGLITLHGKNSFYGCSNLTSSNFTNVQFAFADDPEACFTGCSSLTSLTLDSSVTTIPEKCFLSCNLLTTLNGASNVTSVGLYAFSECSNLIHTFDFTNYLSIAKEAFKNCSKCTFTNFNNVTNFGNDCFSGCNISGALTFKDGVNIGWASFYNTGISSIHFLGSGSLGMDTFRRCSSLSSITFDGDVRLGFRTFLECSNLLIVDLSNISNASLNDNSTGYSGGQFSQCSHLLLIIFNQNITRIPNSICNYITGPLEVTIPASVTEIGDGAFYATPTNITCLATTPPTLGNDTSISNYVISIKVPASALATYQADPNWGVYSAKMSAISN